MISFDDFYCASGHASGMPLRGYYLVITNDWAEDVPVSLIRRKYSPLGSDDRGIRYW